MIILLNVKADKCLYWLVRRKLLLPKVISDLLYPLLNIGLIRFFPPYREICIRKNNNHKLVSSKIKVQFINLTGI